MDKLVIEGDATVYEYSHGNGMKVNGHNNFDYVGVEIHGKDIEAEIVKTLGLKPIHEYPYESPAGRVRITVEVLGEED